MPRKKTVPVIEPENKGGNPMAATEKEFSKLIITDKDGAKYTLEFNAKVVKSMERKGFKIDTDYPHTMIDDLFFGAFQMHNKNITSQKVKEIWQNQTHKDELLGILTKLYMRPLEDLMAEPEGEDENADPTWETV